MITPVASLSPSGSNERKQYSRQLQQRADVAAPPSDVPSNTPSAVPTALTQHQLACQSESMPARKRGRKMEETLQLRSFRTSETPDSAELYF